VKKIDKYEVCGLLGKGGMGMVYKVRMPVVGKVVALKLLSPHPNLVALIGEEEIKRLFVTEAVTMAGLRHPNIVAIWDFHESEDLTFLVMEYFCNNLGVIIGETYRVEEPSRIVSVDKAIHYTRQTLEGLSRLHQAGIIHRDVKPYNILVTDEDTAKITDFGLSKLRGETFRGPSNLMVGSPYYAAPEQEEDPNQVDVRADLYPVGVMLYRMLTGELPIIPSEVYVKAIPTLMQTGTTLSQRQRPRTEKTVSAALRRC
jgi:serine/threonine-protein kinase